MSTPMVVDKISRRTFLRLAGISAAGAMLSSCTGKAGDGCHSDTTISPDCLSGLEHRVVSTYGASRNWFSFRKNIRKSMCFYVPDPVDVEERLISGYAGRNCRRCIRCLLFLFPHRRPEGAYPGPATLRTRPIWTRRRLTIGIRRSTIPSSRWMGASMGYPNTTVRWRCISIRIYLTNTRSIIRMAHGTYDDYLNAMKMLTHDRDGDGKTDLWGSMLDVSWDRIQVHVNGWGGRFTDPANPSISRMAEPESLQAMEWIRARMWDDRVMASLLDVNNLGTRDAFVGKRIAMVEDGSWALKDILANAEFRVGVAPFPAGPVRRVTLATTDGFGIYKGTSESPGCLEPAQISDQQGVSVWRWQRPISYSPHAHPWSMIGLTTFERNSRIRQRTWILQRLLMGT